MENAEHAIATARIDLNNVLDTCGTNTNKDNNVKAHPDVPSLFLTLETVKFTVWIGKLRARLEISLGY